MKKILAPLFVFLMLFALTFVNGSGSSNTTATPVPTPTPKPSPTSQCPSGATALCKDGTCSFSQNRRGTCSHHGGVKIWY